ncbi:MAG: nucleotidyltransferase family protein, partial [Planctomycetota bacterium]
MNPRALPPPARRAINVLRAGLDHPPLAPDRRAPSGDGELLMYLTATGLGPAYRKALGNEAAGRDGPFLEGLDALKHGALARNMVLFAELGRILDAASDRGIDVLAMKGVPAIVSLYGGDIAMRPMADLDLLVRPAEVRPFLALLASLGYARAEMPIDPFVGERGRHLPPLFHPHRGATVEVHRAADYRFESLGARLMPAFFASARRGTVDGRTVLFPSWEAWIFQWAVHLVYTDAYAGKMRDLYDMAVCLESFRDEVDWASVVHP